MSLDIVPQRMLHPFPHPPPLFMCSRVPIKSCLCLIMPVIPGRCASRLVQLFAINGAAQGVSRGVAGDSWGGVGEVWALFELPSTGNAARTLTDPIESPPNCRGVTSHARAGEGREKAGGGGFPDSWQSINHNSDNTKHVATRPQQQQQQQQNR